MIGDDLRGEAKRRIIFWGCWKTIFLVISFKRMALFFQDLDDAASARCRPWKVMDRGYLENGSEQWLVDPGYLLYTGNEKFHKSLSRCTPNPGEMIQFDDHIFQMGWNLKPPN